MSTKRILLLLVSVTIVSILIVMIIQSTSSINQNNYFVNTKADDQGKMLSLLKEYEEHLISIGFGEYEPQNYNSQTLATSYLKSELLLLDDRKDLELEFENEYYMYYIRTAIDNAKNMSFRCPFTKEADDCKYVFGKRRISLAMEENKIFINFYYRDRINFMWEDRDDYINYEVLLEIVDEKMHITFGYDKYNLKNSEYETHETIHYVEDSHIEIFSRNTNYGHYEYYYRDFNTYELIRYYSGGSEYYISHYDPVSEQLVQFHSSAYSSVLDRLILSQFDNYKLVYKYSEEYDPSLDISLLFVEGWDDLKKITEPYYSIFLNNQLVTNDRNVYLSDYDMNPKILVHSDDGVLTEQLISLNQYNLESNLNLQEIVDLKEYYLLNRETILDTYGLSEHFILSKQYITENITNHGDDKALKQEFGR